MEYTGTSKSQTVFFMSTSPEHAVADLFGLGLLLKPF